MNMQASGLALESVGVLAELDAHALREIAAVMQPVALAGGAMLFDEGDVGEALYIVVHGRLSVSVSAAAGGRRVIAELGRGESVGEMALLTGEPRSARVEAIRDSLLLALSRSAFERVVDQYPKLMTQLARQLVVRLKSSLNGAPPRNTVVTVAVIPATPAVRVSEFCEALTRALVALGPTLHLSSLRVRTELSGGGRDLLSLPADDSRLVAWLNQQEERYTYIVYEADPTDTPWSRLCDRQADRVVLVASSEESPSAYVAASRPAARDASPRCEFVLVNHSKPLPGLMQRWLDVVPNVRNWHHLTRGGASDIARIARLVVGQGIGLLLGGGGARAFAHIGVLRAMRDRGIEVDAIGGVSGGAIAGAQYAAGVSPEEMKQRARAEFIGRGSLLDFTVPVVSLIKGHRFAEMLARLFGEVRIEDLPMRFFCLSANLTRATSRVHDRGPLERSIGASMSIPGIGPPMCEAGDLLIDGSVITNLPVGIMRELCPRKVVAVDISAERDLSVDRSWTSFPPTSRLLAARPWRGSGLRIPNILEILFRGTMLGSIASERDVAQRVEFYLRPDLQGVRLMDFKLLERVEASAYEYAVRALEQWPFHRSG